jgi:hypothetical protein
MGYPRVTDLTVYSTLGDLCCWEPAMVDVHGRNRVEVKVEANQHGFGTQLSPELIHF